MIRRLGLILALVLALPAAARETRAIDDDTGTEVEVPAKPRRIVTLHDLTLTLPLVELGLADRNVGRLYDGMTAPELGTVA
jgi:iron complex transport system substrate-binding protein